LAFTWIHLGGFRLLLPTRAMPESKQPVLAQSVITAIVVATTIASAWYCQGDLYGGRTAAHVWWYGWVTALSTGGGALPMIFCKDKMSDRLLGVANAAAGGMMTAASAALIEEGLEVSLGERSEWTPLQCVLMGCAIGVAFIWVSQQLLSGTDDVKLSILEGVDARRGLLIVLVMTVHSFSEGIGIGVSFGSGTGAHLGMLVTTTLAVHNVPEGFAVSSVLVSKGMSVWGAALWSIFTSIPQPIMALLAFWFVDQARLILPIGLGFAAGAMLWVAWLELFAEAHEQCGLLTTGVAGTAAAAFMSYINAQLG